MLFSHYSLALFRFNLLVLQFSFVHSHMEKKTQYANPVLEAKEKAEIDKAKLQKAGHY